jgi:clan AA aspartic protease
MKRAADCVGARREIMGIIRANITLLNSFDDVLAQEGDLPKENVRKVDVRALVDTGASMLTINKQIVDQLGLKVREQTTATLADGTQRQYDIVGPVDIRFQTRMTTCLAMVIPDAVEVLLGAFPLEVMDVMIDLTMHELVVHPLRPDMALMFA